MSKTGYRLKGNQKVYIIGISDTHIGSEQFNEDYLFYALDRFDNIKSPKRFYFPGDLFEAASLRVGNSAFKTQMTLDEQLDYGISTFKPYRKDSIYANIGNHEARLSRDYDFNIMNVFAKALRCEHGFQSIDTFNINGNPFSVYTAHGVGSSKYAHTAQGKFIRDVAQIDADLYLNGHNHRLDFFSQPIWAPEGVKRRYYGFTGAYLKYKGYPDEKQLPRLPEAFQIISVDKDMVVRSEPFYIDQRRPDLMEL